MEAASKDIKHQKENKLFKSEAFFLFHISTIIAVGQYKYNSVEQITLIGTNSENW